ncbi:MAG: WD40 repeat domain-containing protein [archaeon]|nr:WD40 repeat domain-containing protein [archaeon]
MVSVTIPHTHAQGYMVIMLWSSPIDVNDIAVSKDGRYMVVGRNDPNRIEYYDTSNPEPLWWYSWQERFLDVAISANGDYVAWGGVNDIVGYFDDSTMREGSQASPTWSSVDLGGDIERRTLDMSDNGEYILVGGTGPNVFYFGDPDEKCTEKSGSNLPADWTDYISGDILAVDMSSDGRYVAVGGSIPTSGFVAFYEDANMAPPPTDPDWYVETDASIRDIAVSDDGYAVSAVDISIPPGTLYYWADATNLYDNGPNVPEPTWTRIWPFNCVDMSAYGDEVVAGTGSVGICGIHFWNGARGLEDGDVAETWTRHEGEEVHDIGISEDGEIISAIATRFDNPEDEYRAYFHTSNGNLIGAYELDRFSDILSMSGDGSIVAIGGAPEVEDSLYVFKIFFPAPVGGEILSMPALNLILVLVSIAVISAIVISLKLIKKKP